MFLWPVGAYVRLAAAGQGELPSDATTLHAIAPTIVLVQVTDVNTRQ